MGDMDGVFVSCRKVREELTNYIKKRGYKKTEPGKDGNKRTLPDWKKFFLGG
jgi:hypothetical protein